MSLTFLFPRCWADIVAEDVYVTICKTDGYPAALALRNRISGVASGTAAPGSVV